MIYGKKKWDITSPSPTKQIIKLKLIFDEIIQGQKI
jgi:hypothetical protein